MVEVKFWYLPKYRKTFFYSSITYKYIVKIAFISFFVTKVAVQNLKALLNSFKKFNLKKFAARK